MKQGLEFWLFVGPIIGLMLAAALVWMAGALLGRPRLAKAGYRLLAIDMLVAVFGLIIDRPAAFIDPIGNPSRLALVMALAAVVSVLAALPAVWGLMRRMGSPTYRRHTWQYLALTLLAAVIAAAFSWWSW